MVLLILVELLLGHTPSREANGTMIREKMKSPKKLPREGRILSSSGEFFHHYDDLPSELSEEYK